MGYEALAVISVDGGAAGAELRDLYGWLAAEEDLRVRVVERPPSSGEMGALLEGLAVVLAPGGAAAVLAGSLMSWLSRRRSDLTIRLRRADGAELEVAVTQLRGMDRAELSETVGSLSGWLDEDDP